MKYKSPLNGNELWISQTYHITGGNKAIDFGNAPAGTPVYAMANGTIGTISTSLGSYLTLNVENSKHKLFYVHIYNFKVSQGQKVTQGQLLAEIAPKSANGGYSPHLHIGLQPEYDLMDYMDRGITFRTKYQEIKNIWFNGETLNWGLFKDLSYNDNTMSYKIGDKIIFTEKQNKRGGAGTGFQDMGAYEVGEIATIKDNPRSSQNAQFYGKGSSNKTNDTYTWYDTISSSGQSFWVADMGKFRLATSEEINPPKPQEPTTPPELVECQSRVSSLEKEIGALESKLGACEGSKSELVVQKGELEVRVNAFELEASQLKSEVSQLEAEVSQLRVEIKKQEEIEKTLDKEVRTWIESYDALYATHNRVVKEKNEAIEELRQERLKECGPLEGIKLLFNKLLKLIRRLGKS